MVSITCSVQLSIMIRKALETMLDGSEQGKITITEDDIELQSVDSLSVCMCLFKFSKKRFFKYDVTQKQQVKFVIRPFYNFMKRLQSSAVSFSVKSGSLFMQVVSSFETTLEKNVFKICHSGDKTNYYSLPRNILQNCPCFRLHPDEFMNTILDLSVGGGYIELEMDNNDIYWRTFFETGNITIQAKQSQRQEFKVLRPAIKKVRNTYLTKFFKQACNIAPVCVNLVIYIREDGPVLLYFQMEHDASELIISIVPVVC
jgi:hypothetical protein